MAPGLIRKRLTEKNGVTMSEEIKKEQQIQSIIHNTFKTAEVQIQRPGRMIVRLRSDLLPPFVSYLKNYLDFIHLVMISCVDWIEDNQFELVYHLWSYEKRVHVMVKVRLDRKNPVMQTLIPFWRQAETYEREIHEMYGVHFEGHPNLGDLILEDWDGLPPMRRDFDTRKFVSETFEWRKGREDKQDVRQTIAKQYGEKIPQFINGKDEE